MKLKKLSLFKINLRVLTLLLILLLVLDIFLSAYVKNLLAQPHRYRVEDQGIQSLKNLIENIKKDSGYKIVFLGDSATYGSAVKEATQSVPYYTGQLLREQYPKQDIKVYNFGMKGYGVAEVFFVLNALKDADIDLVIYNLSMVWLNREQLLDHQSVLSLTEDFYEPQSLIKLGVTFPNSDNIVETKLQELVEKNWNLYKHRYLLNYYLFGKPLSKQLANIKLSILEPEKFEKQQQDDKELYLPWQVKDWDTKFAAEDGWKFGNLNFTDKNKQLEFYGLMLKLLENKSIPTVIYITPQNLQLLGDYNRIDYQKTLANIKLLKDYTQRENHKVAFLNYVDLISSENFSDSIHLLDQGNKELAATLSKDIDKLKLIGD